MPIVALAHELPTPKNIRPSHCGVRRGLPAQVLTIRNDGSVKVVALWPGARRRAIFVIVFGSTCSWLGAGRLPMPTGTAREVTVESVFHFCWTQRSVVPAEDRRGGEAAAWRGAGSRCRPCLPLRWLRPGRGGGGLGSGGRAAGAAASRLLGLLISSGAS